MVPVPTVLYLYLATKLHVLTAWFLFPLFCIYTWLLSYKFKQAGSCSYFCIYTWLLSFKFPRPGSSSHCSVSILDYYAANSYGMVPVPYVLYLYLANKLHVTTAWFLFPLFCIYTQLLSCKFPQPGSYSHCAIPITGY